MISYTEESAVGLHEKVFIMVILNTAKTGNLRVMKYNIASLLSLLLLLYGCNHPLYTKNFHEDNLMEWQYCKYKDHIDICVNGRTLLSEKCDTVLTVSDDYSTAFILVDNSQGEKTYRFFHQEGYPIMNKSMYNYEIICDKISGHKYLCFGDREYSGVYGINGKVVVPYGECNKFYVYPSKFGFLLIDGKILTENPEEYLHKIYDIDGNQLVSCLCWDVTPVIIHSNFWEGYQDDWDTSSIADVKIVGYIISNKARKKGVLNSKGQMIIPIKYDYAKLLDTSKNFSHCLWETSCDDSDRMYVYNTTGMRIYTYNDVEYYLDDDYSTSKYSVRGKCDSGNADDLLWLSVTDYQSGKEMAIDTLGNEIIHYQKNTLRTFNGIFQKYIEKGDDYSLDNYVDYEFPAFKNWYVNEMGLSYFIEIYNHDDYIMVDGSKYDRTGYHNGFATYEYNIWGNVNRYIYIGSNYQAYDVMRMWNPYSCCYDYDFKKMTSSNEYQVKSYRDDDYNASIANFNSTTQTINSLEYDSDSRWRQYYIDNYKRNEHIAESNIGTLHTLQSDNNPNGTTIYSINTIKQSIQNAQRSMCNLRNEALSKGIIISASYYETCSY